MVIFLLISRPKIPADPISILIAMKAQQTLKEGQMDYGFKKKPIELPRVKIVAPNVAEEKLYDLNGKVIEFKRPSFHSEESEYDDDDVDQLCGSDEDESHERRKETHPQRYYYSDLGYRELSENDNKFVNIPISTTPGPPIIPPHPYYMGKIVNFTPQQLYLQQLWDAYERSYQQHHQCPAYQNSLTRRRRRRRR